MIEQDAFAQLHFHVVIPFRHRDEGLPHLGLGGKPEIQGVGEDATRSAIPVVIARLTDTDLDAIGPTDSHFARAPLDIDGYVQIPLELAGLIVVLLGAGAAAFLPIGVMGAFGGSGGQALTGALKQALLGEGIIDRPLGTEEHRVVAADVLGFVELVALHDGPVSHAVGGIPAYLGGIDPPLDHINQPVLIVRAVGVLGCKGCLCVARLRPHHRADGVVDLAAGHGTDDIAVGITLQLHAAIGGIAHAGIVARHPGHGQIANPVSAGCGLVVAVLIVLGEVALGVGREVHVVGNVTLPLVLAQALDNTGRAPAALAVGLADVHHLILARHIVVGGIELVFALEVLVNGAGLGRQCPPRREAGEAQQHEGGVKHKNREIGEQHTQRNMLYPTIRRSALNLHIVPFRYILCIGTQQST